MIDGAHFAAERAPRSIAFAGGESGHAADHRIVLVDRGRRSHGVSAIVPYPAHVVPTERWQAFFSTACQRSQ
jgi:hypothetical protein